MKLRLKQAIFIFLCVFVVLSLVQAAGATDISAAPLNSEYIKYIGEEQINTAETVWTDNESQSSNGDEWNKTPNSSPDTNVYITAFTSNTLRVPSENYYSIQSAVDAARAGDTVIVESGTYPENVIINSTITLRGTDIGDGFPVIDACGYGSALSVTADGVTVEGFALTGSGEENGDAGLYVEAGNATLVNLGTWGNANNGISICGSANSTLTRCTAHDNGEDGIFICKSAGSILVSCTAHENGDDGIYLEYCPASLLLTCTADMNANDGIQFRYCDNSTLTTCFSTGNYDDGMDIWRSGDTILDRCTITSNSDMGLYLLESPDCILNAVDSTENNDGLHVYQSPGTTLTNCIANDNSRLGILIRRCNSVYEAGTDTMALSYNSDNIRYTTGTDATGMDGSPLFSTSSRITSDKHREEMQEMSVPGERERDAHDISGHADVNRSGCRTDANNRGETPIYDTPSVLRNSCMVDENSDDGIKLPSLKKCILTNNSMEGNRYNFDVYGQDENEFIHSIDTSNTVNGKLVYYLIDATGNPEGDFADAGTIYAINCAGLDIHDLTLSGNGCGIYFLNTTSSTITDVMATENEYGIYLDGHSSNNCIATCEATHNTVDGISLDHSSDNEINKCTATENWYGIYLWESSNNSIATCEATRNTEDGIFLDLSSDNEINKCTATENGYGIYLYKSSNNSIATCEATRNTEDGISLRYSSDNNKINNCTATENEYGIYLYRSDNNSIATCEATENERGIFLYYSKNNSIINCEATENEYGIYLHELENSSIVNCEATENEKGMYLGYSEHCTLTGNTMNGNQYNFDVEGWEDVHYVHSIDTSNTVDGKTAYYLLNATTNPEENFTNAGTIYAINCTGLDIHDLTLSNNECGIYFWNTTSSTITDVMATKNKYGILLEGSSNNSIVNCRATENGYLGVRLLNSEYCTLTGNTMDKNQYNFHVSGIGEAKYIHSIDTSNTVDGKPIYYLLNATANPEGNFTNAGTIYAVNCTGLDIHDLTISNGYAGICTQNCSGLDIHNLTLSDNYRGIELRYNTNISLDTITATDNYYGIYTYFSSDCTIQGVNARNNLNGVYSHNSENIHISDCTMQNNRDSGINLWSVRYCTISNCTTSDNFWYGFKIRNSENCILSLNSFINNTAYERDSEDILWNTPYSPSYLYGENMWKKTSQMGNYWGEAYTGTDRNGDGIGDTPFTSNGFTDTFPLMEPLSAYTFVDNEDSDDGNDAGNGHVSAAGNMNAGDAVTMQFEGTAVTGVTITAAEHINTMVVTVGSVQTGPEGLNGPVYQYLEADLIHTTDGAVAEADFTFTVPKAWLTAQGLTPEDVVLWRYHDGVWVPLPTEIVGEEGDNIVFSAVSPGFSYFAIAENDSGVSPVETTPAGTPIPAPVTEETAQPVIPSETEGEAATATPSQQSPAGIVTLLTGLGTAALLFRRH